MWLIGAKPISKKLQIIVIDLIWMAHKKLCQILVVKAVFAHCTIPWEFLSLTELSVVVNDYVDKYEGSYNSAIHFVYNEIWGIGRRSVN